MKQIIFYMAVLIGLFLALAYFKGFSADVGASGSAISKLVLFLQGRDSQGNISNYPR